jgi:autotransporter-associated beta strand protein
MNRANSAIIALLISALPTSGAWADLLISGGTNLSGFSNLDDGVVQRTLPTPLRLYDQTYGVVDVSTNGNLNFSADPYYGNSGLPNVAMMAIMPLWDDFDLTGDAEGSISETTNAAYYAVTWNNVKLHGSDPAVRHTFQAAWFGEHALLKGFDFHPGDIAFSYGPLGESFWNGGGFGATVGLQGESFEKYAPLPESPAGDGVIYDTSLLPAGPNQFLLFRPYDATNFGYGYASAAIEVNPSTGAINLLRGQLAFNGTEAISRDITGSGLLVKSDPGTVQLLGNNSFVGGIVVSEGTVRAGWSGAIPSNTVLNLFEGATFDPAGNDVTVASMYVAASHVSLGAGSLAVTGTTSIDLPTTIDLKGGALRTDTLTGLGKLQFINGTLEVTGSGLTIEATGPLGSAVTLGAGQTLRATNFAQVASGSLLILNSGGHFGASSMTNHGEIVLDGTTATLGIAGDAFVNLGLVRGEGRIVTSVENRTGGEIRAEQGKRLRFVGANNPNAGKINLQGGTAEFNQPLTNSATGQIFGRGTLLVGGTGLSNFGSIAFSSGITDVFGPVANYTRNTTKGITISGNSDVTFWGDVTNDSNSLFNVSSGSSATFFGTVTGSIGGLGSKYFEADITPGAGATAIADLQGDAYLSSTARLVMELGGEETGLYDEFRVGGQLLLDGTLEVSLHNGFMPLVGQSFDLLDWGSRDGVFAAINLPALSGVNWDTSELYTLGTLSVVAVGVLGDYNGDGSVNAADYTVYRNRAAGIGGTTLDNEGVTLGEITVDDYYFWKSRYGDTAGSGATLSDVSEAPEPTSFVMGLIAAVIGTSRVTGWKRRRDRRRPSTRDCR